MSKLALNKSSLNRERKKLETYRRFLPSLELKQKQLTALRMRARRDEDRLQREFERERADLGERFPMIASDQFDLQGMVTVEHVQLETENVVGVMLPRVEQVQCRVQSYSLMAEPHWVDNALHAIRSALELRIRATVARRRREILDDAVRKITQRVNLFKEVLIPQTEENIRRIAIYLGDAERSAVIRAKIAKSKLARGRAS